MSILDDLAHLVLMTASDAIVAADRDGLVRFWNPGAERIFGFSSAEKLWDRRRALALSPACESRWRRSHGPSG